MPKKSTLQSGIGAIKSTTWESINQCLLQDAKQVRVEPGKMVRLDSTVTDSPIHEPSDSTLLWDSMRVMVKLLQWAEKPSATSKLTWHNHSRVAKNRARAIWYTKGAEKKTLLYKDLVRVTEDTLGYVQQALIQLAVQVTWSQSYEHWRLQVNHYTPLIERVIAQTRRRVFDGEKVPAREKLFSLFEEHTDIIVKGSRDIQYGHKLNLTSGRSGLILDLVIEEGNRRPPREYVALN